MSGNPSPVSATRSPFLRSRHDVNGLHYCVSSIVGVSCTIEPRYEYLWFVENGTEHVERLGYRGLIGQQWSREERGPLDSLRWIVDMRGMGWRLASCLDSR
jgi:hypothetical protein